MIRCGSSPTREITIKTSGVNHAFLKEVARRTVGLEEARRNAKASHLLAEDYADHAITFDDMQSTLTVDHVTFDLSSGYNHSPYIKFENKRQGVLIYGQFNLDQLKRILNDTHQEEACCRCNETLQEPEVLKDQAMCTHCVVETT